MLRNRTVRICSNLTNLNFIDKTLEDTFKDNITLKLTPIKPKIIKSQDNIKAKTVKGVKEIAWESNDSDIYVSIYEELFDDVPNYFYKQTAICACNNARSFAYTYSNPMVIPRRLYQMSKYHGITIDEAIEHSKQFGDDWSEFNQSVHNYNIDKKNKFNQCLLDLQSSYIQHSEYIPYYTDQIVVV